MVVKWLVVNLGGLACNVCGNDTLALAGGGGVEYAALHFGGKLGVHGVHVEFGHQLAQALQALVEEGAGCGDGLYY